jgi:hypothetical protein
MAISGRDVGQSAAGPQARRPGARGGDDDAEADPAARAADGRPPRRG